MTADRWSLQDAKNKFSAVVDAALHGRPQLVTRRGQDAVVVISSEEYARLKQRSRGTELDFKEYLLAIPQATEEEDDFERIQAESRDIDL
jgi:prevent-host-death family protein